jgi:hypothetical protein
MPRLTYLERRDLLIAEVPSSDGKRTYYVRQGTDGVYYCTCRGWVALNRNPKGKGGPCKHMQHEDVAGLIAARRLSHTED